MKLQELEKLIKEMRETGASENTEVEFYRYTAEDGYDELSCTDINLYYPETRAKYIQMTFI